MSEFLSWTASEFGGLSPSVLAQTPVPPAANTSLAADDMQGVDTCEPLFDALLLSTGSQPIVTDEVFIAIEDEQTLEVLLPELPDEQVEQMAQQFLATLVNRDVPVLMASSVALSTTQSPATSQSDAPLLTGKAKPISTQAQILVHAAATKNHHVLATQEEPTEGGLPKTVLTPAVTETLRLTGMHASSAGPVPVISAGHPQAQVNAPIRADGSGQALATQLQHALGERLNLQINNQIQHATIRLDPPDMGRIDIVVQIEAGKIQVQINAGQSDVYRALTQVSHELRQALTEQHFVNVDVRLSNQNQQQQPGQHQRQRQSGRENEQILANEQPDRARDTRTRDDKSILMTI